MADLTILNIPDDVVAGLDKHAEELGLSRNEFILRLFMQDAQRSTRPVTVEDFRRPAEALKDLANPEIMAGARK